MSELRDIKKILNQQILEGLAVIEEWESEDSSRNIEKPSSCRVRAVDAVGDCDLDLARKRIAEIVARPGDDYTPAEREFIIEQVDRLKKVAIAARSPEEMELRLYFAPYREMSKEERELWYARGRAMFQPGIDLLGRVLREEIAAFEAGLANLSPEDREEELRYLREDAPWTHKKPWLALIP